MNNMSETEFKAAIVKHFGAQCETCVDELYNRFCKDAAALLYCGLGNNSVTQDNPYLALNVMYTKFD